MERRKLGSSGLDVPVLSLGTGTFGGSGPLFGAWGNSGSDEARRLVDLCLEAGANLFDTADAYSFGAAERVLGEAISGRRDAVILVTKIGLATSEAPGDWGLSRRRLIRAVEDSLQRLGTDHVDLLQLHGFDAATPVEELLGTLDTLVAAGKVRHVGVSNYPSWQLMKALAASERDAQPRFVSHQVHYSLVDRSYEHDLMPLGAEQGVAALVWSPLGWGRLTGRIRRGAPIPEESRLHRTAAFAPPVEDEHLYHVIDALEQVALETGKAVPQVAINWLLGRPTIASVILGARNEAQLRENLGAVGWSLDPAQIALLDRASAMPAPYPHFLYRQPAFARLNPPMI